MPDTGHSKRNAYWDRHRNAEWSAGIATVLAGLTLAAAPASADLKLCNATGSRVGVAIGYRKASGWITEGWWNISAKTCDTLLKGKVPSRYIYVYAIDYERGGEWAGTTKMCTAEKSFSIEGVEKCIERGYQRSGFYEVDTGDAKDWTIRLSDPEKPKDATDTKNPS
jgi:uncharacterized membrane protein